MYSRRTGSEVCFDDYLQLATVGLIESIDRFDPGLGVQFKTFASKRIQGSILTGLERLTEKNQQIAVRTRVLRERIQALKESAAEMSGTAADKSGTLETSTPRQSQQALFDYLAEVGIGLALSVMLEGTGMVDASSQVEVTAAPGPEVIYFRKSEIARMRTAMRDLVDELGDTERMVISHHYLQEICFDEIARLLGVSRSRVSQIHRNTLIKLRRLVADRKLCDLRL